MKQSTRFAHFHHSLAAPLLGIATPAEEFQNRISHTTNNKSPDGENLHHAYHGDFLVSSIP